MAFASPPKRWPHEGGQAMFIGTRPVALGMVMFLRARQITSGTAGLALLLHDTTRWSVSLTSFLVEVSFFGLALRRMCRKFILKNFGFLALRAPWVLNVTRIIKHRSARSMAA